MKLYFDVTVANRKRLVTVAGHVLVEYPRPRMPEEARKHHWAGDFIAELHVSAKGSVDDVKVLKSTGHAILDEEATRTLRAWRFRPEVASFRAKVPITFTHSNKD